MEKKKSNWPLIVGLGVVWIALVGGGLTILVKRLTKDVLVTEADKAAVVGAFDLIPYFDGYSPDKEHETLGKSEWFDQSVEIEYEYDSPLEEDPYINVTISKEASNGDASAAYMTQWSSLKMGFEIASQAFKFQEDNTFYQAGDRSRFANIELEGEFVGHLLVARKGNTIYSFLMTGFVIDDPSVWKELFDGRIAALE